MELARQLDEIYNAGMEKPKILITDSLFISRKWESKLAEAGYEIERLDKVEATEEELCQAIVGKTAYILGGLEKVTKKVIDSADKLKVIAFTGIGYHDFIPAHEYATQKGIAITSVPDGPTHAVAEWAISVALAMTRNLFELGRTGDKSFLTTTGLEGQTIGILGLGRIGTEIAKMLQPFKPASVVYWNRHRQESTEANLGLSYAELEDILSQSDVLFLCLATTAGHNFIDTPQLSKMKDGALLVTITHSGMINPVPLLSELKAGRLKAASDYPLVHDFSKLDIAKEYDKLPLGTWFVPNGATAFNTKSELELTDRTTVESVLNVLKTGSDKFLANPEYKK